MLTSDVSLADVFDDIATLLRPELDQRRIVLRVDIKRDETIRVDQSQFEQVIINVIRNAMESSGEDGQITVAFGDRALTISDASESILPRATSSSRPSSPPSAKAMASD